MATPAPRPFPTETPSPAWIDRFSHALAVTVRSSRHPRLYVRLGRQSGVHMSERLYRVLTRLAEFDRPKVVELARYIDLDRSTISRSIQELVRLGYVRSDTDSSDRRSVVLTITTRGRRTLDRSWTAWQHAVVEITRSWSQDEREVFLELFERFAESFESFVWDGEPPAPDQALGAATPPR